MRLPSVSYAIVVFGLGGFGGKLGPEGSGVYLLVMSIFLTGISSFLSYTFFYVYNFKARRRVHYKNGPAGTYTTFTICFNGF